MATKRVSIRLYPSASGVVLLGIDWTPPKNQPFFGFAIRRTPGFHEPIPGKGGKSVVSNFSWLENRLSFAPGTTEFQPSNLAPIQRFQWWDARYHPDEDAGKTFSYEVIPMTGQPGNLVPFAGAASSRSLVFPDRFSDGVGLWFNRPFVSSQAFNRLLQRLGVDPKHPGTLSPQKKAAIYSWLGNGLQDSVPDFAAAAKGAGLSGAVYHLTDERTIAALEKRSGRMVLHWKNGANGKGDTTDRTAQKHLDKAGWTTRLRDAGNLMHNKILVDDQRNPAPLLMGSANFTLEAYTTQANVLHVWKSGKLAALYDQRVQTLLGNPQPKALAPSAGWSPPVALGGGATARVFFSPETDHHDQGLPPNSIAPIVEAIRKARSSILFCLFDPTDEGLLEAVLDAVDKNKAAYGLLNQIPRKAPSPTSKNGHKTPGFAVKKRLFDFTRDHNEIVGAQGFLSPLTFLPEGWVAELNRLPFGQKQTTGSFDLSTIHVHHKFVLVDGETDHPVLFTGSANLSNNSATRNDENTLWVTGHKPSARAYLAEFMRLFEHYRARPVVAKKKTTKKKTGPRILDPTGTVWWQRFFQPSPRATARRSFGN